jgi:hypothetical protein
MKAFIVFRNYQSCDSDGWNHWVEQSVISYHLSIESANNKIYSLIKATVDEVPNKAKSNPHIIDPNYWDHIICDIENNLIQLCNGTCDEYELYKMYDIRTVEIEP